MTDQQFIIRMADHNCLIAAAHTLDLAADCEMMSATKQTRRQAESLRSMARAIMADPEVQAYSRQQAAVTADTQS